MVAINGNVYFCSKFPILYGLSCWCSNMVKCVLRPVLPMQCRCVGICGTCNSGIKKLWIMITGNYCCCNIAIMFFFVLFCRRLAFSSLQTLVTDFSDWREVAVLGTNISLLQHLAYLLPNLSVSMEPPPPPVPFVLCRLINHPKPDKRKLEVWRDRKIEIS